MRFLARQIDRRIAAYQRELIETHYQEVETMYRQMRAWRHDCRNHLQAMKALSDQGDMEGCGRICGAIWPICCSRFCAMASATGICCILP